MEPRVDNLADGNVPTHQAHERTTVVVVGAGLGGLCAAISLKKKGIDFVILERESDVGGCWRDNTYPGAACDVPSVLYSFSFAQVDWSQRYATQPEIHQYARRVANQYGLSPHLRLGTAVTGMCFDDQSRDWIVETNRGVVRGTFVILAIGQLSNPSIPSLAGRSDFVGNQFHSARWDHTYDLSGKRVGVVGNGASAIQFVPRIADTVGSLTLFQRSANYVVPKNDRVYARGQIHRLVRRFTRMVRRGYVYLRGEMQFRQLVANRRSEPTERQFGDALAESVSDEATRQVVRPDYPAGCKRILISNEFLPTLDRDNVRVETSPIARVTPSGITLASGTSVELDAIIYATGFRATEFVENIDVVGANGAKLHSHWRDGAEAVLGITVPEFPNMFLLYGPNTNLATNSIIFMLECQVAFVMRCLRRAGLNGRVEARTQVVDRYNRWLDRGLARSIWATTCRSWYKLASGRITNNWPFSTVLYAVLTRVVPIRVWMHTTNPNSLNRRRSAP